MKNLKTLSAEINFLHYKKCYLEIKKCLLESKNIKQEDAMELIKELDETYNSIEKEYN